ncbi:hypothetical protein K493DRAFT_313885 [Basidiobolus meristosporus CBS 931.73]|uniref:Knr4/Smi1-like domain-containing protein n=1 Tax=Basidiobolus meristosporus CBS 931.73 TaxID=1314790 RepID=A0A1Y1YJ00_9FUNG|nr:hypothetical protein K493DRAFT_313885 [Basidiobolus meristosporus CBS 931.73]|eukprot:ORX97938.1 hypothetical protein K493DRAFT_313885 [Basidiobolus meristosporus CBS 931.73]
MVNSYPPLQNLAEHFKDNSEPAQEHDFEELVKAMEQSGVSNPAIPEELKEMWKIASEWHLVNDHYNVFGFNIYRPESIVQTTLDVIGGDELRKEWAEEHGKDSCGGQDWLCLAGYSEYDYIFVNFNAKSAAFGAARHMVNNQNVENEVTKAPFSNFVSYVHDNLNKFYQNVYEGQDDE